MKLIKPSVEYIPQETFDLDGICEHIEKCARVCYKSEDLAKDGESVDFVNRLIDNQHLAMLEHASVYLESFDKEVCKNLYDRYSENPYSKVETSFNLGSIRISTNYRVIQENGWHGDLKCIYNPFFGYSTNSSLNRYTIKIITDLGVCREILRHRKFSFANESTRYCAYDKDKFGNELTFIIPHWVGLPVEKIRWENGVVYMPANEIFDSDFKKLKCFTDQLNDSERRYMELRERGLSAQDARQVLPLATKTELIMTGFKEDWDHFFSLRYYGTTGKPHPDMQYIAKLAFDELESKSDYRYPRDEFYEGVTGTSFNKD